MRKLLLFTLLLVLGISFCSNIFAQVTVTLGEGTQSNSTTGTPTPYGTFYMNFRQQYLVLASDLNDIGGGPGNINSVAFNVDNVNTCSPMPNFRIRVKATEQTALSSTFEVGDYTEVFQVAEYMPVNGWNTHTFSAPFNWDGASNLLIDVVTDLIPGGYTQNASVFYTATTFNSTLRAQSDTAPAIDAPTGTATMNRANMQFNMEALDIVDLNALSIEGPTAPSVNSSVDYAVSVKNYSLSAISTYTVKLMQEGGIELASVPGTIIEPQQTLEFTLPWTPAVVGETHLYGKVVMAGDENPANDETNMLTVTVMEEGLQVVEIGDGTEVNTTTGMPTTYGTYYKNFRQQYLVLATELNDLGGGPGPISSVSFNVAALNTCSPMPNYRIRIKPTEQTALSTTFEVGEYTEVFQAAEYMPVLGWNTHTFSNAFVWDGASNLIIEVVTDLIPGSYTQNASVYYTTTGFNSSLRAQSDSSPAIDATSGTISTSRSNMRLVMMALDIIDMNALTITGPSTPSVNSETEYTVTVKNYSPNNVDEYTVKLMQEGGIELASVPGTLIEQHQTLSFTLPWTPSVVGETHLYGKVVMAGDENPENDETNILTVNVMEAGLSVAQIGTGTETNSTTGVPTPYGTFYKNFRQQYLYTADEIYAAGGVPGLINALAFNVADVAGCSPMPNYRIRVKHTTQEALTTTFEEGEYTQVFHADEFLPTNEWNVHSFSTPFFWNGGDNLLVDIVSDLVAEYTRNALVYYTPTSFSSALRYQSDSSPADAATTGTLYSNRSNIRFFLLVDDMGSLSGTVTENGVPLANVHIQVEDTVFSTTSGANGVYTLPHVPVGTQTVTATKHGFTPVSHTVTIALDQQTVQDFEMVGTPEISISPNSWSFGDVNLGGSANKEFSIANAGGGLLEITDISISGSTTFALGNLPGLPASLGSEQELNFTVTFTPNAMGETNAEIIITDNLATRHVFSLNQQVTPAKSSIDSRSTRNENRTVHTIQLNGYGVNELTIGTGEEEGYYPINFYYNNSLFETIYTAEEMNNFIGMITGIKFYTNFNTELMDKPVKIWLGSTALTNLSAGWIPSTDLTLVFDGNVSYPAGESIVSYTFPEPYMHLDGGNLVMLVQRPMDTGWVLGKYFKIQTVGTDRSRNIQNDYVELDPANPSDGTLSGNFPKTTFSIIPGGVGHVTGTVIDENAAPLPGVQVLINGRNSRAVTDENGQFYIANILPGDYVVSFSRYGYIDQDINIVLEEDETEVLDVTMQPMPKVIVSGTVLASDTGVGIAGANIQLEGYADYAFTTNASGVFQSEAEVYANFTYEYQIAAAGYVSTSGSIEVGDTDYSMGDIVLAEIAYAPTEVTASLNDSFDGIDIEWSAPDPNAIEITQSFEDATFPPSGWSQLITNNSPANSHGVRPTWGRLGTINDGIPAVPTDGTYQAGLCWIMEHQDEWLITNSFNCPPDAYLSFDTYLEMGSPNGDHYYVKASIDGGVTWTELWDGAAQTAANNYYTTPIHIDLVSFNGQHIKLAFHADDPPDELGLWKNWYIDNIYIGNYMEAKQITNLDIVSDTGKTKSAEIKPECSTPILHSEANMRTESRALVGYKIWRLLAGQEQSEETWIALNDEATSNTSYTDDNWNELENGTYRWAVKSVYTSDVMSSAAFSNSIIKDAQMGNIVGFVRGADNAPLAGATVSAGTGQSTTTNSSGYYILSLSAGSYTLTATATDYHPLSYDNIPVIANQNTTRNFQLVHTSNNDEMVPVTVTALNGNYPNPFNPETTISYDLKEAAPVQLDIFNLKGQLVRTLVNENQAAGRYRIVFDAKDFRGNRLSSGVYFYRMRTGSYINTRKMLLME
ncbi:MAG: carboxypeptidase regulatory-like domain-containing protein [Candidatus Cloacimonetes bacterium]|nr:carboxypeptidase regulatory-like domain-containing protein [Candidatus Cloacimonadota bacterium]